MHIKDSSNMGSAMALSAFDSIDRFFKENDPDSFDLILTGDLGRVGSSICQGDHILGISPIVTVEYGGPL